MVLTRVDELSEDERHFRKQWDRYKAVIDSHPSSPHQLQLANLSLHPSPSKLEYQPQKWVPKPTPTSPTLTMHFRRTFLRTKA